MLGKRICVRPEEWIYVGHSHSTHCGGKYVKNVAMAAAALALTSLFSTAAMAKEVDMTACTKDGKTVTMKMVLRDDALQANPAIEKHITDAFVKTANSTAADDLQNESKGGPFFSRELASEDIAAIDNDFSRSPVIGAQGCSVTPAP